MRSVDSAPGATITSQLNPPADALGVYSSLPQMPAFSREANSTSTLTGSGNTYLPPVSKKAKAGDSKISLRPKLRRKRSNERPGVPEPITLVRRPSIMSPPGSIVRSPSFPPPRVLSPPPDSDSSISPSMSYASFQTAWAYPGQEDVDAWLDANGFERYKYMFFEHEVNMDSLFDLEREDLREMGIRKVGVILNILRAARNTSREWGRHY